MIGPSQPVVARVGDDAILSCHIEPPVNMEKETVWWDIYDLGRWSSVHLLKDGRVVSGRQHPSYNQRTSLFPDELSRGNLSLKLSRVKLSDDGTYQCSVPLLDKSSDIHLHVGKIYCSKYG